MCPRLFSSLLPAAFPIDDPERFEIMQVPAADLVRDVTVPFAQQYAALMPPLRKRETALTV
eukprot:SAG22_NODE_1303_length_4797_cov_2976.784376_4_plen_61_part_00